MGSMSQQILAMHKQQSHDSLMNWISSGSDYLLDRRHIVPQAMGDVVEVGICEGQNLPYYKASEIKSFIGVDQNPKTDRIELAARDVPFAVEVLIEDVEALSLADESADCVVSTYTLSAVKNPTLAISEIRRILRPGGVLLFCEQGRHPREHFGRLQDKFSPLWQRLNRGVSINRNIFRLIAGSGFRLEFFETDRLPLKPMILGYHYAGIAIKY